MKLFFSKGKKALKKEEYFLEMLKRESEYRAETSGNKANSPFVMPLLFLIRDMLRIIMCLLCFLIGYVFIKFLGL